MYGGLLAFGDISCRSSEFRLLVLGPVPSFRPVQTVDKLQDLLVSQTVVIELSPTAWAGFLADSVP